MDETPEINVRSSNYLIARSRAMCGHCGSLTTVVALVMPPGHEILDPDAQSAETPEVPGWQTAGHSAFLFHITYLPGVIAGRLGRHARFSRRGAFEAEDGDDWANHCERCGCRLDDQDLFCEPEAAFLPVSTQHARTIQLLPVGEPFQAAAAGYAPALEFFDAMSRG